MVEWRNSMATEHAMTAVSPVRREISSLTRGRGIASPAG